VRVWGLHAQPSTTSDTPGHVAGVAAWGARRAPTVAADQRVRCGGPVVRLTIEGSGLFRRLWGPELRFVHVARPSPRP